ncbi:DUF342 domain-containing protein [bacterium]|nr:DUF342 domain-containing protein [bacterium]
MATAADIFMVEVSRDGLEAMLMLRGAPGEELSYEQMLAVLAQAGVVYGIDTDLLQAICAKPQPNQRYVIARGKAPKAASDEELVLSFNAGGELHEDESGHIDFRNLGTFNSFKAGDVLASRQCNNAELKGMSVRGEELAPPKCKPVKLSAGRGARISDDGTCVIAEVSGHACIVGGKITVMESIEVREDVDFSVGNIDFIGNVKIRGSVHPGFQVRAQGDVEIGGNIEKATIECGGNLLVHGLVFGHGNCRIRVGGDAQIGALDQAEVTVVGDLRVENYIRHCHVICGASVELTGKKGNIVGGEVSAYRHITAPNIGNPMATLTKLNVGVSPFARTALEAQEKDMQGLLAKREQVNTTLNGLLRRCGGNPALLDARLQDALSKLKLASAQIEQQIQTAHHELDSTRGLCADYHESRIKAADHVYPGVLLTFRGKYMYKTTDQVQFVSFSEQAGEVKTGTF